MKYTKPNTHPLCRKASHPFRSLLRAGIFGWSLLLAAPDAAASLTNASPVRDGAPLTFHIVKKGDTLNRISHRYNVTVEALRQANGLKGDLIRIGDRLTIPVSASASVGGKVDFHVVGKGDYLAKIAKRYGVTTAQLMDWNGLSSSVIHPGQRLRVSALAKAPAAEALEPEALEAPKAPSDRIPAPPVPVDPGKFPQELPEGPRDSPLPDAEDAGGPFQKRNFKNLAELPFMDQLRVQVFLDGEEFAPGKIDGEIGEFTDKAAQRWMKAHGRSVDRDSLTTLIERARAAASEPTIAYAVIGADLEHVGKVAASIPEQARQSELPYASLAEAVSERFHTDIRMLGRLNPGVDLSTIGVGSRLIVPQIRDPFDFSSNMPMAPSGPVANHIVIVWPERILEVRARDDALVASFPVTLGDSTKYVRSGTWRIGSFAPLPSFRWDASVLKSGIRSDRYHILPPGPNNLVGVLWMGLKKPDGSSSPIGIHGTNQPETIGRAQSAGCIRLANWDVVRLSRLIGHNASVRWSRI